jgi:hypothetical protein
MRIFTIFTLGCAVLSGAIVHAQETLPDAREAKRLLFGTKPAESRVADLDTLSGQDRDILTRLGPTQKYYGAIAYAPDEGLLSAATYAAANHHSVEVARGLALTECNANRAKGSGKCVIAADIVPQKYEAGRALQLNVDATLAIGKEYRRAKAPKSFAVSASTGQWGFGTGDDAAIAACDATDCTVVVRD